MAKKKNKSKKSQVESSQEEALVSTPELESAAEERELLTSEADLEAGSDAKSDESLELSDSEESEDSEDSEEASSDFEQEVSIFLQEETESDSFIPEASDDDVTEEPEAPALALEGTELDAFESAAIEEQEFVEEERLESIIESILFASDRPVSLASLKLVFKGTNIRADQVRRAVEQLAVEYAGGRRGVSLEEAPGGYQLRTKIDNLEFLRRTLKTRSFKLSGPALEVLSIVAYKQPVVKAEIDEIRGVESGHLLRALMEKNLVNFEGKSELPGRPMQYGTTKKFLEIFGLRNLKELPTLSQIDELLPEGIGEDIVEEKQSLSSITDSLSETVLNSYSQGEEELMKIQDQLQDITTSSQFFEDEKKRQLEKRDQEKAQNIREALAMGEPVSNRDANWLKRYDEALAQGAASAFAAASAAVASPTDARAADTATGAGESIDDVTFTESSNAKLEGSGLGDDSRADDAELERALAAFDADNDEGADGDRADTEEEDELFFTEEADDIDSGTSQG